MSNKTTAELIAWVKQMRQFHEFMAEEPESEKDKEYHTKYAENLVMLETRLAELEAALETITNMHDGNPSPIANPEPLDYARQVMRDMRLVAKQALQPKEANNA